VDNKTQNITKTAVIITAITALSRILGFAREAVVAAVFGMGAVTDAYAVAVRVVGTAAMLMVVYLTQVFIPTYARSKENEGEEKALKVANNVFGVSLVINLALMALLYVLSPFIIGLTGFEDEQASLALTATNIVLLQLPLLALVNFFVGYMTARKSFFGPNFIGFPMSIVFIGVVVVFGTESGVVGISVAALLSVVAQAVLAVVWIRKQGYRHRFSFKFNTPEIKSDMKLLVPAFFAGAVFDIKGWVDIIIATYLGEGNTAAINFAMRLISLIQGLLIIPIAAMVFSYMSEYAAKNDTKGMLDILWRTVRVILFIVLPIVVIAMPSSFDVVSIAFERGEFTYEDTLITGTALMWFLPGLLGMATYVFLVRVFYGLQDMKMPMVCGIITVAVNIGLSIWLSSVMAIGGLALATSIASTISALLLLIFLRWKIGPLGFGETARDVVKMVICAIPCLLVVFGARNLLTGQHEIIRFAGSTSAGGCAYLATAFLLKTIVMQDAIQWVKERTANKKQG